MSDELVIAALKEIAAEIRVLRVTLLGAIAPAMRDDEGVKTRDGYLRTQEMPEKKND